MKKLHRTILFFALLFTVPGVLTQAQDMRVSATVDSNRFQIGEWITLRLVVHAPEKYQLRMPATDDDIENGDFVSASKAEVEQSGGRKQYRQEVVATVFDTGSIALRVRVQYVKPGDTTTYESFSPRIVLEMTTVALDTTQSFRDIKDVLHVPLSIWDYLLYAAIVLLISLLVWYGYRFYKRRLAVPEDPLPEAVPEIPPYVAALQALAALREKKLWQSGEYKFYQSQVTDILRNYIERRFRLPAMEQPTSEIMPALSLLGLPPQLVERVEQVLRTADLTKFAKYMPSSMQHENAMTVATQFVETTGTPDGRQEASARKVAEQTETEVRP